MLYYLPLEGYQERYTLQWSAPKAGWLERRWREEGIEYIRIDGASPNTVRTIKAGCVLDAVGRSNFCFSQISKLLELAENGEIKNSDTILLDDFFTPGIEALPYAFSLMGLKPKMYAFLHAQSVDQYDFTRPMMKWGIRHFERGIASILDGIFVCCSTLKDCVVNGGRLTHVNGTNEQVDFEGVHVGGLCGPEKVFITGHPFASDEVMERMPEWYRIFRDPVRYLKLIGESGVSQYQPYPSRKNQVIWSSRWDKEKQPELFLGAVDRVLAKEPYTKFVICTSARKLRSNDPSLLKLLSDYIDKYPNNIELKEGLSKEAYYAILCESKVQTNMALQDWVAISLLEASVAGAYPIYPAFRSFVETFRNDSQFLYTPWKLDEAADKMVAILNRNDLWTYEAIQGRSWIHTRFDSAYKRQLQIMGILLGTPDDPYAT